MSPEQIARQQIDAQLVAAGWAIQDDKAFNPSVARGIALREVPLASGRCDYLFIVDRIPLGVTEAKLKQEPAFGPDPVNTIWRAFEQVVPTEHTEPTEKKSAAGSSVSPVYSVGKKSGVRRFADLVSLVRFALEQQPVLEPFSDSVQARFDSWLRQKDASISGSQPSTLRSQPAQPGSRAFTPDQLGWLRLMADHIATSLSIDPDDFGYSPFAQRGGLGRAHQLFGEQLPKLLEELDETLAA